MSTILPAGWPLATSVLHKTYVRLNKWTLRGAETVQAWLERVAMGVLPAILISCVSAANAPANSQCGGSVSTWMMLSGTTAIAGTLAGVGMNLTFLVWGMLGETGAKKMILAPQGFLFNLNGFLVSLIVAGAVFFVVSMVTRPGPVERKSLALFFHESLS